MSQTQFDQNEFADMIARDSEGAAPSESPEPTAIDQDEMDSQLTTTTQNEVARLREFIEPAWNAINDFLMKPLEERTVMFDNDGRFYVSLNKLYESKDFSVIYGKGASMSTGTLDLCTGLLPYNLEVRELITRQLADLWVALHMTRCGSMVEKIAFEILDPTFAQGQPQVAAHFIVTTTMDVEPPSVVADEDGLEREDEEESDILGTEVDPSTGEDI